MAQTPEDSSTGTLGVYVCVRDVPPKHDVSPNNIHSTRKIIRNLITIASPLEQSQNQTSINLE
jgi:hypothetical protein